MATIGDVLRTLARGCNLNGGSLSEIEDAIAGFEDVMAELRHTARTQAPAQAGPFVPSVSEEREGDAPSVPDASPAPLIPPLG